MIERFTTRVFALLLNIFPYAPRRAYRTEMLDIFARQFVATRSERGTIAAFWYALIAYADLVIAGTSERYRSACILMDGAAADVRYAVRSLGRSWTFTIVSLLSLAVGLGINIALLLFLRLTFDPPRAVDARGAVEVMTLTDGRSRGDRWSWPDFDAVQRVQTGMEVSAWLVGTRTLRGDGNAQGTPVNAMFVSANYFRVLGIKVTTGRSFLPEEDDLADRYPAVVSESLRRSRFPTDSNVLGKTLTINRTTYTIVGVAPRGYQGHFFRHGSVDVWVPLAGHSLLGTHGRLRNDPSVTRLGVIGRLLPGTSVTQASAALVSVLRGRAEASPATNAKRSAVAVPYTVQGGGETGLVARAGIFSLSGLVLFVVCLNIGGMVLVRSAVRERELAVRQALGATRSRLVRFLMAESTVVALGGGVLGMAAALIPLQILLSQRSQSIPVDIAVSVIVMCIAIAFAAAMLFGLSPALRFSHPNVLRALKSDTGTGGRRTSRVHRVAISLQTALALPLVVINAMVLDATGVIARGHYGFEPEHIAIASIDFDAEGYSPASMQSFLIQVGDALRAVPGVTSVSASDGVPLDYQSRMVRLSLVGSERQRYVRSTRVTEGFFETIGTQMLRGRAIVRDDRLGSEPVAVITQTLAEQLWPSGDALGKRVAYSPDREHVTSLTVVGVAADVVGGSHESEPTNIFVSLWQFPTSDITIAIRTASDNASATAAIQSTFVGLDARMTPPRIAPLLKLIEPQQRENYAITLFLGGLGLLTLFLAAIGIYGVVAFAVTTRTREIGVRMAMGASRRRVLTMVLSDAGKLAAGGIVVGILIAVLISREVLARWFLYLGRSTLDWRVLVGSIGLAVAVVILSTLMPAVRAAGVQPMQALRKD